MELKIVIVFLLACVGYSMQQSQCQHNPCKNGATCWDSTQGRYFCTCAAGFEGTNCENYNVCSDDQLLQCFNGGTCVVNATIPRGYGCHCLGGFEGDQCQTLKIDVCTAQRPCQNGGQCLLTSDRTLGYICQCLPQFEGTNCQTMQTNGACSSDPCLNGGTCFRASITAGYLCVCRPGYGGTRCEQVPGGAVDACESLQPCLNGGACFISSSDAMSYICVCSQYFSGSQCELSDVPDLCLSNNPCQNNSTCVHLMGASSVTCQCAPGYVGEYCDIVDTGSGPCLPNPCVSGGTCNPNPFADGGYTCSCVPTFSGINCELEYMGCSSNPCLNYGTCIVATYGTYFCECPAGYVGRLCDGTGPCASSPCVNGGLCMENPQIRDPTKRAYNCRCSEGFMGTHCEQLASADPCDNYPCGSGVCYKSGGTSEMPFVCVCPPETVGDFCNEDPCLSQPCVNGGSCNPIFNPTTRELVAIGCICPPGYTGPTCAVIGPCQSNPCQNGGICIDSSGSSPDPLVDWSAVQPAQLAFFCMCSTEWAGTTCSETSNPCSSNPCENNGECHDIEGGGYTCICQGLYAGQRCERRVEPCEPNPCMHSGRCLVMGETYSCQCEQPFVGTHCERSDPCASNPCYNNATCFRSGRDQQLLCVCNDGFTGTYCQEIMNNCLSKPCQNGGTCYNGGVIGFVCVCTTDYTGTLCHDHIPTTTTVGPSTVKTTAFIPEVCRPNPCLNNGTCLPVGNGPFIFTCFCAENYAGLTCAVHLERASPCESEPCLNGGTCWLPNRVGSRSEDDQGFFCVCDYGFEGNTCALFVERPSTTPKPPSTTAAPTTTSTVPQPPDSTHTIKQETGTKTTPLMPQICFHDGSVYEEAAVRTKDCVKCTCINGEWLCGERDCDCMIDGVRHRNSATWSVDCNTCICSGGVDICTEMMCGTTCDHNGSFFANGVTRQSECNSCVCEDGNWDCTEESCDDTCVFGGNTFFTGEMRKESCNSCFCLNDAQWLCTVRDCQGSPVIITGSFKINQEFDLIENSQQRFITLFKEDLRQRYNLAKQNIQNVMVFPGSIIVMFDLVEVKDSNVDVQAIASDLGIKIQNREYSLSYEGLDLFADPSSFKQERLITDTGPQEPLSGGTLQQSTIILIAVIGCGTLGLIVVISSVCYFTRHAPRRARTEYGDARLPRASDRAGNTDDGFVNIAYQESFAESPRNDLDRNMPRNYNR